MTQMIRTSDKCQRCGKGSMLTDDNTGEMFCSKCGFVASDRTEQEGPEWRSFSKDEHGDRARAGTPTSLAMHDMGLATIINPINKDASGKPLTASMKSTIERLRTWDSRSQVHEPVDRNFRQAFSELDRLKDKLALSDAVIEKTAYIYRKALDKGLVRGRSIPALVAASLYAACRNKETPRTLDLKMPVVDPIKCVSRIASISSLNEKTKRKALEFLDQAMKIEVSAGKDPMGLAAAALYLACVMIGENKTQKDIAQAAGVTEVTIRNRYKGLKEELKL